MNRVLNWRKHRRTSVDSFAKQVQLLWEQGRRWACFASPVTQAKGLALTLGLSLALTNCGLGLDDDQAINETELENQQRLRKLGERIKGTYLGEIEHFDGNTYDVEVRLYYILLQDGTNEDGEIRTLPRLKGQIRLPEFVYERDLDVYDVRFNETGTLEMVLPPQASTISRTSGSASSERVQPQSTVRSVSGRWQDGQILNAQWVGDGVIGSFEAKRQTREVESIGLERLRERLLKQFQPLAKTYSAKPYGMIVGEVFEDLEIRISTVDSEQLPVLTGDFVLTKDVLNHFRRVPIQWDPRTQRMTISFQPYPNRTLRLRASGQLTMNSIHFDRFLITAKEFQVEVLSSNSAP